MRHSYSTDSAERRVIPFFIAASAIGAAYLTVHLLQAFHLTPPWWLSPLDTMGYYGAIYWLFDNCIWRLDLTRRLRITRIPDLSGKWVGHVISSYDADSGNARPKQFNVTLKQTWREILVLGDSDTSSSHSVSAAVLVNGACSLSYEYVNEPAALAPGTMHIHRGTARLLIKQEGHRMEGDYYSGRDRQNIGIITLRRFL
jgi:hypothetical protein